MREKNPGFASAESSPTASGLQGSGSGAGGATVSRAAEFNSASSGSRFEFFVRIFHPFRNDTDFLLLFENFIFLFQGSDPAFRLFKITIHRRHGRTLLFPILQLFRLFAKLFAIRRNRTLTARTVNHHYFNRRV